MDNNSNNIDQKNNVTENKTGRNLYQWYPLLDSLNCFHAMRDFIEYCIIWL